MGRAKGTPTRVREAIRKVERAGWRLKPRGATNHRQYTHPQKGGRVTVSGNPGDELSRKTLESIKNQMQITDEEWDNL